MWKYLYVELDGTTQCSIEYKVFLTVLKESATKISSVPVEATAFPI